MSKNNIIVDLDGTLCDIGHRLHLIQGEDKDYETFYKNCEYDAAHYDMCELVSNLGYSGMVDSIYIITGRPNTYRAETDEWLDDHEIPYDKILMRQEEDYRPDYEVKEDLVLSLMSRDGLKPSDIWLVLEDNNSVVKMYRKLGFRVLQVDEGVLG